MCEWDDYRFCSEAEAERASRMESKAIRDFDNHWTHEQREKIRANTPPWLIGDALAGVEFSRWYRFKEGVMQRLSNFMAGRF